MRKNIACITRADGVGFACIVLASSCSSSATGSRAQASAGSGDPAGTLDDAQIEAAASQYATLAKLDKAAYPTRQHAGNPLVDVYANAIAAPAYRTIDFGVTPDAPIPMPPGSMLVKAMLDPSGAPPILTVMYKKAPGYDPANGDWWYGRLNADGTPTDPAYAGVVDFCVSCHAGAPAGDHVWGIVVGNK